MKCLFVLILVATLCGLQAQQVAITTDGDTVYLYDDGSWSYDDNLEVEEADIAFLTKYSILDSTNQVWVLSEANNKSYDKEDNTYTLHVDDKLWERVPSGAINPDAEYCFMTRKDKACYAMLINEEVELGLYPLFNIAMENAKIGAGTEPKISKSDYVMVNGKQMIMAEYDIKAAGLDISMIALYYSDEKGSTQYISWTMSNIFEKKKEILLDLLKGLVIKN